MISAATIEMLVKAGVQGDTLIAIVRQIEADHAAKPRSANAERQARFRANQKAKAECVTDSVTDNVTSNVTRDVIPSPLVPPLEVSPTPPSKTPPIIPQTQTPSAREAALPDESRLAFDAFNELAGEIGLSKAQAFTDERRTKIRQRLNECGGLTGWMDAMSKIRGSPFLCGDNDRGWKASLDFLLQKSSFTRLMEGSYDRSPGRHATDRGANSRTRNDAILDAVLAEAKRREDGEGDSGLPDADAWAA